MIRRLLVPALAAALLGPLAPAAHGLGGAPSGQAEPRTERQAVQQAAHRSAQGVLLSRPGSYGLRNALLANINNTPAGGTIRVTSMSFTDTGMSDALGAAARRGVTVRVIVSHGKTEGQPARDRLAATLARHRGSGLKAVRHSARGQARFNNQLTTFHQKSWTFSRTGSSSRVSIITSANMTAEAHAHQWNDGFAWVNDGGVYDALNAVFKQQWRDQPLATPYRTAAAGRLRFSPWNGPAMGDPVLQRIRSLPVSGLRIRIAMAAWHGPRGVELAQALVAKKAAGAKIQIVTGSPMAAGVRRTLRTQTRNGRITLYPGFWSESSYTHTKFMTAEWRSGGTRHTRVWTGSENWAGGSVPGSDELTAEIVLPSAHDHWVSFFKQMRAQRKV